MAIAGQGQHVERRSGEALEGGIRIDSRGYLE